MSVLMKKLVINDLLTTLVAIVICFIGFWLWKRRRLYYLASKIPGWNGYPLIGKMLELKDLTGIVPKVVEGMNKYGSFYKLWVGPFFNVMVAKPEYLQAILNNNDCLRKCPRVYNGSMEFVGTGLIVAEPDRWRKSRKRLNPAFNQKILNSYVLIFREQSEILVRKLKSVVGTKAAFNFYDYVDKCTLDIVCETSMSAKSHSQDNPTEFFKALSIILNILIERVFRVWLYIDFIWERSTRGKLMKKYVEITHHYTNMILATSAKEHRKAIQEGHSLSADDLNRKAFLDILLEAQEKNDLTNMEVMHEISTMIFAGYDTTAIAMSYVMLCCSFYPDVLTKVHKELDEIFDGTDRPIEVEDLNKMDYLERVIKETLRMYPPVGFSARRADKEIDVGDGYVIPEDSTIWISHYLTHRNPQHWPDPLRFDPDRFLPEQSAKRHPYAYIPFSAGTRNCIGFKYGMMMMKVILANVLRNYSPTTTIDRSKMVFSLDVVLKLVGGFMITLEDKKKIIQPGQ